MSKEEIVKEVITILDTSSYIDPAEHLYDGLKQIKREITYATVHDFLWALESSTVIDVDGRVTECANKIKPLLADMIIDEVYKNYFLIKNLEKGPFGISGLILPKEDFINECKTDTDFSEKWGLKIEERELSTQERNEWFQIHLNGNNPFMKSDWKDFELDQQNIPTKLITLIYNNETIESYEN